MFTLKKRFMKEGEMASVTLNPMFMYFNGTIGRITFYTRWRKSYAREYVKPRNPKTEAQRKNRNLFRDAMKSWQGLTEPEKAEWNRRARRLPMTGHNLYISRYMKRYISELKKTGDQGNSHSVNHTPSPVQRAVDSVTAPYSQAERLYSPYITPLHRPGAG